MNESFIFNLSSVNYSAIMVRTESFDYASALQYVEGLPTPLFYILLVSFVLFAVRLFLLKLDWDKQSSEWHSIIVLCLDLASFVALGTALCFCWVLVFKPSVQLLNNVNSWGQILAIGLFVWFGYMLWSQNKKNGGVSL